MCMTSENGGRVGVGCIRRGEGGRHKEREGRERNIKRGRERGSRKGVAQCVNLGRFSEQMGDERRLLR